MKASLCGCFKGVTSLSDLFLAGNVDIILYQITGLVVIFLLLESYKSSDDVSNESSEDKDSYEVIMVFCAIWTCSSNLIASKRTCSSYLIASL